MVTVGEFFKPRSEITVNPNAIVERGNPEPVVGLDGGILVPTHVLGGEGNSPLGKFLQRRTIPTGSSIIGMMHDLNGKNHMQRAPEGIWHTSRSAEYYDVNFNPDIEIPKADRRKKLMYHLEHDAELLHNWGLVVSSLGPDSSEYETDTKWRVLTAVFQNFSNDLIGLDYAYRVAANRDPSCREQSQTISKKVFRAVKTYYETLLHPDTARPDASDFEILERAPALLRQISRGPTEEWIDDIRTQRETDATYTTLAAAKTFHEEFGPEKFPDNKQPAVIVPLLGAYDLGPALKAVGYKGEIVYITPVLKLLLMGSRRGRPKRESIPQDIVNELPRNLRSRNTVLFDDSLGSGTTCMDILKKLRQGHVYPMAIRTVYINDKWQPGPEDFTKLYGGIYSAYFESSFRQGKDKTHMFSRGVTQRWAQKYRQNQLGKKHR